MPRKRYFKLNFYEISKLYDELESDINTYLEPINQPRAQEQDNLDKDLPNVNCDKSVNITTQIDNPYQEHTIRQSNFAGFSF